MPEVSKTRTLGRSKRSCGFSLLEMALAVAIVIVIAAIAVPSMMQARMKANEASAVASLRAIDSAQSMYTTAYPTVGYSGNLADLGAHGSNCETLTKTNSCLIMDDVLISGVKSGYTFELVGDGKVPDQAYTVTATPESMGSSGRCAFGSDQTGAIRVLDTATSRFSENNNTGCGHS
jgi:type IV pilus assembly protein PilA